MKAGVVFLLSLAAYLFVIGPFTTALKQRPVAEKLGYLPEAGALKYMVADHRALCSEWTVLKVLFYYGGLLKPIDGRFHFAAPPEYYGMYRMLQTALRLDPYNMDAYYFAQAAFTWELGRVAEVNSLLDYGMRYRTWDYQLPFFAGFNTAYFLKDYPTAANYMKRAAELSGESLFTTLAARYFYEAGRDDLGILFLDSIWKNTKDEKVKRVLLVRREALVAVQEIRSAMDLFRKHTGNYPETLKQLVQSGFLPRIPKDPYGGRFYLDGNGRVVTTSRLAFHDERDPADLLRKSGTP